MIQSTTTTATLVTAAFASEPLGMQKQAIVSNPTLQQKSATNPKTATSTTIPSQAPVYHPPGCLVLFDHAKTTLPLVNLTVM